MTKNEVDEISLKAFTHIFIEAQKSNRRFCFILGAGASREANILTGVEMAKIWVDEIEEKYDKDEIESLMKKLKIESIEPNSKNYFGIYDLRFYPDYQYGHAYFERELEKGSPSIGHHTLAKILAGETHNLVITTNFDSLLEDALFIYTNKHPLVVGHESLTEFINLNIKRPIVAKVHRSLYFRPFNREKETDGLAEGWKETLKNAFMVYTPIVVGYSGGDRSLMKFLQDKNTKMNGLYWCYWNKEEPSEEILSLVKSKNGCLVPIEGFDEMMFTLSSELSFKNPEDEMRKVTQERIEKYNSRYEEFEKKIRQKTKNVSTANNQIDDTIRVIDKVNLLLLEESERVCAEQKTAKNYMSKGKINYRIGRYVEAIEDYTEAIKLKPDYAEAYNNRGYTYGSMEKYDKAIEDYTEAIRLKPDYANAYNNRGCAYDSMEKYDKAIEDYTEAIRLKPDYADAYNNRGYTYDSIEKYDKAIEDYTEAIRLKPDYADAYNNRGYTYDSMEKYDKAIEDYTEAIRLKPDYADIYNNRGYTYNRMEKYDKAIEDFAEAIKLNLNFASPYKNMAQSYYNLKDYNNALDFANKAIEHDSQYKKAFEIRADIYCAMGELEKAKADEDTAKSIN